MKSMLLAAVLAAGIISPAFAGADNTAIVTITMDDAFESQFVNAMPVLKSNGLPATFFITTKNIDVPSADPFWQTMTWAQIKKLSDEGFEIGGHTVSHGNLQKIHNEELEIELLIPAQLIQKFTGIYPKAFAAPAGLTNEEVIKNLKAPLEENGGKPLYESQSVSFGPAYGYNDIYGRVDPYQIVRREVSKDTSPDEVCKRIKHAVRNQMWLVLMYHNILDIPAEIDKETTDQPNLISQWRFVTTPQDFKQSMDCLKELKEQGKVRVLTISQALEAVKPLAKTN